MTIHLFYPFTEHWFLKYSQTTNGHEYPPIRAVPSLVLSGNVTKFTLIYAESKHAKLSDLAELRLHNLDLVTLIPWQWVGVTRPFTKIYPGVSTTSNKYGINTSITYHEQERV
jgi:hypothetical protein